MEGHEKKLSAVAARHSEQESEMADIATQARQLMENYRKLMLQLSSQCVYWDEVLSQHEAKKS